MRTCGRAGCLGSSGAGKSLPPKRSSGSHVSSDTIQRGFYFQNLIKPVWKPQFRGTACQLDKKRKPAAVGETVPALGPLPRNYANMPDKNFSCNRRFRTSALPESFERVRRGPPFGGAGGNRDRSGARNLRSSWARAITAEDYRVPWLRWFANERYSQMSRSWFKPSELKKICTKQEKNGHDPRR